MDEKILTCSSHACALCQSPLSSSWKKPLPRSQIAAKESKESLCFEAHLTFTLCIPFKHDQHRMAHREMVLVTHTVVLSKSAMKIQPADRDSGWFCLFAMQYMVWKDGFIAERSFFYPSRQQGRTSLCPLITRTVLDGYNRAPKSLFHCGG